ncbi:MAG TPA: response regulator [Candidatus Tectomicrobia bacterium]|jgi:CheY-like chemotaxis protein
MNSIDAPQQSPDDTPEAVQPQPPSPPKRILVVEDDAVSRYYLVKILEKAGYEPVPAQQTGQALRILTHEPIDLVLADIMMPVMDGIEMVRIIRQNPQCDRVPVLMCSALRDRQHVMTAASLDIQGYLVKPIDRQILLERVATVLKDYEKP